MTWRDVYVEFGEVPGPANAITTATVQLPPSCKTISGVELVGYRVKDWPFTTTIIDHENPANVTVRESRNLCLEIKELPPSELISNLPQHDRIFAVINHTDQGSPHFTNRAVIASQFFRPQKVAKLTFQVYETLPFTGITGFYQRMGHQQPHSQSVTAGTTNIQLWLRILVNQDPNYSN